MNCDWIAPYYRYFEYLGFGRELERRRFRFLPALRPARRALVIGDGDGRFLARLAQRMPGAEIDSIEASVRMQELARRRCAEVHHHLGDARRLPLDHGRYDLIATHFFLDCLNECDCRAFVARVASAAAPTAQWLISEFRENHECLWRRLWGRAWVSSLYTFFRVATGLRTSKLVDHRPLLENHGFRLVREETSRFGLLASELWQRG